MRLSEFTGARRIPLVGRQDLLKQAERSIGRGGIHITYLEGGGGIGKTALLEAILEQTQRGNRADALAGCCVAGEVIDLYHADVHTSEGLIRRIVEVLGPWSFEETEQALTALDRARVAGDMDAAGYQSGIMHSLFLEEFEHLTEDGVVLAFDTMEVVEYEHDLFQEDLGETIPVLSAADWLFKAFFPAVQGNVEVLLAGRPCSLLERLEALRQHVPNLLIRHTVLEALDAEETREYLKVIAQAEGKRGDGDAAARLWAFCEERSEVVLFLTGGRPILLALVADMVAQGWALPPCFSGKLEDLHARGAQAWWPEVEQALVVRIQESPTPIGDTIRTLAWLRKGATPELLARMMDLKTRDGEWDIYTATGYLDQVAQLALVKIRPGDRRVFLHDEMYTLLEKHVLQRSSHEERNRIYGVIQAYYQDQARELERRIEQVPPGVGSIQAHLRQSLVEEMHYRLRHKPPLGFAMYFWLAEEALMGRDTEMDMLLRSELLRTLGMLEDSGDLLASIPRQAQMDIAVRWGIRALFLRGDPERALDIFDQVRRRWGKEAARLGLAWVHMQLYRAVAKIQRADGNDWAEARDLLITVQQEAERAIQSTGATPVVEARHWRARILKGLALNYRGYLDRQQGRYLEAVGHYQESAMLQRRLGMATLSSTLTNLSFAMALTGEFHHARLLAEEAESLARRSGKLHVLALALNVRALVECYDGHHKAALRYTDRALEIAADLPAQRSRGLIYLTRARARRYLWDSLTEAERRREPEFFEEALKEATQAVGLLRPTPADRVEALLERGCIYRDLARLYHHEAKSEEAVDMAKQSARDLERMATLAAAIELPRQLALAWTNLGWLHYYLGREQELEAALQQAYQPFPQDYLFPNHGPLPPMAREERKSEATLPYWSTLGKAEMLKAYLALDRVLAASDGDDRDAQLQIAVRHITLSLAYDELVADAYFDLTRAEEGLHKRILEDGLSIETLHRHARKVADEQSLGQPTRLQRFLTRMFGPADLWA